MLSLSNSVVLAKHLFARYYASNVVEEPHMIASREFGFVYFDREGMDRHMSFSSLSELVRHIRRHVPRHAYYSSAYYRSPDSESMSEKGWSGADLSFDIDVDHVPTPCKERHDSWRCLACGLEGAGHVEKCRNCGSERLQKKLWVCEKCINVARDETLKLLDFLLLDFGLSSDEIEISFSGHRGFHVKVRSDAVRDLDQDARREIADYVRGIGIDLDRYLKRTRHGLYRFKRDLTGPGWTGRLSRSLYHKLMKAKDGEELLRLGIRPSHVDNILKAFGTNQGELALSKVLLGRDEWRRLFLDAISEEAAIIDEKVTIDIKRLMRLPGTLHGKTGLKAFKLSYGQFESIDVLERAAVFHQGHIRLYAKRLPKEVLDHKFEEVHNVVVEVPTYLGLYLLLNGGEDINLIKASF